MDGVVVRRSEAEKPAVVAAEGKRKGEMERGRVQRRRFEGFESKPGGGREEGRGRREHFGQKSGK